MSYFEQFLEEQEETEVKVERPRSVEKVFERPKREIKTLESKPKKEPIIESPITEILSVLLTKPVELITSDTLRSIVIQLTGSSYNPRTKSRYTRLGASTVIKWIMEMVVKSEKEERKKRRRGKK